MNIFKRFVVPDGIGEKCNAYSYARIASERTFFDLLVFRPRGTRTGRAGTGRESIARNPEDRDPPKSRKGRRESANGSREHSAQDAIPIVDEIAKISLSVLIFSQSQVNAISHNFIQSSGPHPKKCIRRCFLY